MATKDATPQLISTTTLPDSKSEECIELVELKESLMAFSRQLTKMKGPSREAMIVCIKSAITIYVDNAFHSGVSEKTITQDIYNLCHKDMLVPSDLTTWAIQQVEAVYKTCTVSQVPSQCPETHCSSQQCKLLFSDETLFHTIICCNAISLSDIKTCRQYLESLSAGHLFGEVSMTDATNTHQYLIARQKDRKLIYVAFKSEPRVSVWSEKCAFEEGISLISIVLGSYY